MRTLNSPFIKSATNLIIITIVSLNTLGQVSNSNQNISEIEEIRLLQMEHQFTKVQNQTELFFLAEGLVTEGDSELRIYRSLEDQYYKQKNYEDALNPWRWLFTNAPKASKNIYIHGAKITKYFIKKEKDEEKKSKYIDTLMMIYKQRIDHYGQKGYVLGQMGLDLCQHRPEDVETAYNYLKESIELKGDQTKSSISYCFIYSSILMLKSEKIQDRELLENFLKSISIVDNNIAKGGTKVDKWEKANDNLLNIMIPYLKCDVLLPFYEKSFKEYPDDLPRIKKMQKILKKQKCTDSEIYFKICERIIDLEPSAKASASLAVGYYSKRNYNKAIIYYKKAIELEEENLAKSKFYLVLSDIYRKINNYPNARGNAQNAARLNPNDGIPYLIIGDIYAASSSTCGNNSFQKKAVYWAAVDQYLIAKARGADGASLRVAKYKEHFPTKEDAFYQDPPIRDGDEFTIGCWMNVTTKARFNH